MSDKKKVCIRCGHDVCPHCNDWCDVVLYGPEQKGCHIEAFEEIRSGNTDVYPISCCSGRCVFYDKEKMLTVEDLIEILKTKDPKSIVLVDGYEGDYEYLIPHHIYSSKFLPINPDCNNEQKDKYVGLLKAGIKGANTPCLILGRHIF